MSKKKYVLKTEIDGATQKWTASELMKYWVIVWENNYNRHGANASEKGNLLASGSFFQAFVLFKQKKEKEDGSQKASNYTLLNAIPISKNEFEGYEEKLIKDIEAQKKELQEKVLEGAYQDGAATYANGYPETRNPYKDSDQEEQFKSWAKGFSDEKKSNEVDVK